MRVGLQEIFDPKPETLRFLETCCGITCVDNCCFPGPRASKQVLIHLKACDDLVAEDRLRHISATTESERSLCPPLCFSRVEPSMLARDVSQLARESGRILLHLCACAWRSLLKTITQYNEHRIDGTS